MGFLRPFNMRVSVLSVARPRVVMVARFLICVARPCRAKRDMPTFTPYSRSHDSRAF